MAPYIVVFVTLFTSAVHSFAQEIEVDEVFLQAVDECEVPARVQGVVSAILVEKGKVVEEGVDLVVVDDSDAANLREARAFELTIAEHHADNDVKVRLAKKSLEVATADLQRTDEANSDKANSVSPAQVDLLRAKVAHAQLEIENAVHEQEVERVRQRLKENELRGADLMLRRHKITSPISGVVVDISARKGEWVEPSQTVLRVIRIDQLYAEAFVNAIDVTGSLDDLPVTLEIDMPGQPAVRFTGRIEFVSPELDPADGRVLVRATIDNSSRKLKPGMKAKMIMNLTGSAGTSPTLESRRDGRP